MCARPARATIACAPVLWPLLLTPMALATACRESPTELSDSRSFQLAFVSDRDGKIDLYLMAGDGSGVTRLTDDWFEERAYEWSPDGSRLAVLRGSEGRFDLWTLNADGSDLRRLTDTREWETSHQWSPDGKRIAFSLGNSVGAGSDIWVVGADGSGLTNLTRSEIWNAHNQGPVWSRDGRQILFSANRRDRPDNLNYDVFAMNSDGSGLVNLTRSPDRNDAGARCSPDGSRILFQRWIGACTDVHVMNMDGTGVLNLSRSAETCERIAAWSPDGARVAFHQSDTLVTQYDLYVVRVNGMGLINLTSHPAMDSDISWSPDGSLIAFTSDRDGARNIYAIAPDGSGLQRLTISQDGRGNWLESYGGAWRPAR